MANPLDQLGLFDSLKEPRQNYVEMLPDSAPLAVPTEEPNVATNTVDYVRDRNPIYDKDPMMAFAPDYMMSNALDARDATAPKPEPASAVDDVYKYVDDKQKNESEVNRLQSSLDALKPKTKEEEKPKEEIKTPEELGAFALEQRKPDYDLDAALAQSENGRVMANIMRYVDGINAGHASRGSVSVKANPDQFKGLEDMNNAGLRKVEAKRKEEDFTHKDQDQQIQNRKMMQEAQEFQHKQQLEHNMKDVNSRESSLARELMSKALPGVSTDGLSAAQLSQQFPFIKTYLDDKTRRDIAKENAETRKMQMALMGAARDEKNQEKHEATVDKLAKGLKDDLDANRSRAGNFGKMSETVIQAEKLHAMTEQFKDGNLPVSQVDEFALGLARMISGTSGSSRAQVEALVPHSISGDASKLKSWLTNNPVGAGQQKFIEMMMHTVEREKDLANSQMNAVRIQRLNGHERLKKLDPSAYTRLVNSYGIQTDTDGNIVKKPKIESTGKVLVRLSNGQTGQIPQDKLEMFKKDHPDAQILGAK
jgi:hypothetical protein